jgi:hypothetical protein
MMNSVLIRNSRSVRRSVIFNAGLEGMAIELVVEEGQVLEQQEHRELEGLDEEPALVMEQ